MIEKKQRSNGEFYFEVKAPNGQVVLYSEDYYSEAGRDNGIESVKQNSLIDDRYDKRDSATGKPYFNLKAGNGQIIGHSMMYESAIARDNGIASLKNIFSKHIL